MSRDQLLAVVSFLLSAPLFVAWAFALADIARRRDLRPITKAIYAVTLFFVVPATLVYLLARPTSVVGHRTLRSPLRAEVDWRDALLRRIETSSGSVPVVSRSDEGDFIERITRLRVQQSPEHLGG